MIIYAPISVGELYDKITILQVKSERFDDVTKLTNVRRELEELRSVAKQNVEAESAFERAELDRLVSELREINEQLWDIEDGKRAAEGRQTFDDPFIRLARDVYLKNDRRAAIKKGINMLVGSTIVEEKGHGGGQLKFERLVGTLDLPKSNRNSSAMTKTFFLFPGAHKTGTSLLQSLLEKKREKLEASGIAIARRQAFYRTGMHRLLQTPNAAKDLDRREWLRICNEVFKPDWQEKHLILSSENAFGEIDSARYREAGMCLENLLSLFPDHKFQIKYYVRRQDSLIESLFIQNIHRGGTESADEFYRRFGNSLIDWTTILSEVANHVGWGNLEVMPCESLKSGAGKYSHNFFFWILEYIV